MIADGPIFVGEAEPAAVALQVADAAGLLLDVGVGDFLHRTVADDADEALVQHGVAGDVGLAAPQDQRVGAQRDRRVAGVLDRVGAR